MQDCKKCPLHRLVVSNCCTISKHFYLTLYCQVQSQGVGGDNSLLGNGGMEHRPLHLPDVLQRTVYRRHPSIVR